MPFHRGQPATRRNTSPEHHLQSTVREYLVWCLPPSIEWTANAAGVPVSAFIASKMKNAGVRRGWPDLQFLFPDGVTRYIELKRPDEKGKSKGVLSAEQKAFQARCAPHSIHAVCRSIDEVADTLRGWGVAMKRHPFAAPEVSALSPAEPPTQSRARAA